MAIWTARAIILHALINFSGFLASGVITGISTESPKVDQVISEIVIFGLMAAYGYWLLRQADRMPRELSLLKGT